MEFPRCEVHGVDLTDSFEAFLPQLQIEAKECEGDMPRKNFEIAVVIGFNQIDFLMSLQDLHELRLVPSLPPGLSLNIDRICIVWMILKLRELFD